MTESAMNRKVKVLTANRVLESIYLLADIYCRLAQIERILCKDSFIYLGLEVEALPVSASELFIGKPKSVFLFTSYFRQSSADDM